MGVGGTPPSVPSPAVVPVPVPPPVPVQAPVPVPGQLVPVSGQLVLPTASQVDVVDIDWNFVFAVAVFHQEEAEAGAPWEVNAAGPPVDTRVIASVPDWRADATGFAVVVVKALPLAARAFEPLLPANTPPTAPPTTAPMTTMAITIMAVTPEGVRHHGLDRGAYKAGGFSDEVGESWTVSVSRERRLSWA